MDIRVFVVAYNEEAIMPYFFRHYNQFASQITLYDDNSTDRTAQIALENNAIVIMRGKRTTSTINMLRDTYNSCWKCSREADWVFCVESDEFVYHHNMIDFLSKCKKEGNTLLKCHGWCMVDRDFPCGSGQIYDEVNCGLPSRGYDKTAIFDPKVIQEINYGTGQHFVFPTGTLNEKYTPDLKLLHMKFVGLDKVHKNMSGHVSRLTQRDAEFNWGVQYKKTRDQLETMIEEMQCKSQKVITAPIKMI
jgi:glycosyltransferase involved in cell wall biosynthesis